MDPQHFASLSKAFLTEIEDWIQGFDPDELDYETSDGVLDFEFPDGTKFVLNRQAGNHQMWLAAGVSAWHYDWDAASETWQNDRDGHGLRGKIAEVVGEKLGRAVEIT